VRIVTYVEALFERQILTEGKLAVVTHGNANLAVHRCLIISSRADGNNR